MSRSNMIRLAPGPMTDRMLEAAYEILAEKGAAGLKITTVARRMGVSTKPVRTRVGHRSDLLVALWDDRLGALISADLAACITGLDTARATGDREPLIEALTSMLRRTTHRDAAAEALLVARFDPELAQRVADTLGSEVGQWLSGEAHTAARRAFVLCLALGMLIMARAPEAAQADPESALPEWIGALLADHPPARLPRRDADHLDAYPDLAPGDPALHILLNTTLEQIGARGFDNLTVSEIATRAGFTEGMVFHRYATKLDLFVDATRRQNAAGWQLNNEYTTGLERDFEKGVAEAIWIREIQQPGRELPRSLQLEQVHLSWHHPELAAAQHTERAAFRRELLEQPGWEFYESQTDFFLQVAFSVGGYLLPFLVPQCYALPHDVVTVPLHEAFARRRAAALG